MRLITTFLMSALAMPMSANADLRYADPAFLLQELKKFREECSQMLDGEVREEIFGIEVRRSANRCIVGQGEVDENLATYFATNPLEWAGLEGDNSIWVTIAD